MLTWLKTKLAERQRRAEGRARAQGFEYAAAELLARGEAAAEGIEADVDNAEFFRHAGPFEEGALDAVRFYRIQRRPDAELIDLLESHSGALHIIPGRDACLCGMCQWIRRRNEILARHPRP